MKLAGLDLQTHQLEANFAGKRVSHDPVVAVIIGKWEYPFATKPIHGQRSVRPTGVSGTSMEGLFFNGLSTRPEVRHVDAFRLKDGTEVRINHAGILSGSPVLFHRAGNA